MSDLAHFMSHSEQIFSLSPPCFYTLLLEQRWHKSCSS